MKPVLPVFCGAIAMAWLLPRPLGRLSGAGVTRPAVYCMPGRPPTIVLTTGALADPPPPARRACHGLALAALTLAIVTIAALVPVFAATGMAG